MTAVLVLLLLALSHRGRQIPAVPTYPRDSLLPAGMRYQALGRFDSARFFFQRAEDSLAATPFTKEAEKLYYAQAMLHFETGHYQQSLPYFDKAIAALLKNSGPDDPLIVQYKNNLAAAHRRLQQYKEALAIYTGLLVYNINVNELRRHIADMLIATGQYWPALHYLHNVYYDSVSIGDLHKKYNSMVQVCLAIGNLDSAGYYLSVADSLHAQSDTTIKTAIYGLTLRYRGDWYRKKGDHTNALLNYQLAAGQLLPSYNKKEIYDSPDSLADIADPGNLFQVLKARAAALSERYQQTNDPKDLAASLQTSLLMARLGRYVENNFAADAGRLPAGNSSGLSHRQSIGLCLKLYQATHDSSYLQQAFLFDEQNKLRRSRDTAGEQSVLPDSLEATVDNLKQQITRLAMRRTAATDSATVASAQIQQGEAEAALAKLRQRLNEASGQGLAGSEPDLARLRQKVIPRGSAILSYYTGDSLLVGFLITADTFDHFTVPVPDSFFATIKNLYNDLQLAEGINNKTIGRQSKYLYRHLLQPVQQRIDPYENLMIIPDDTLRTIPFELLQDSAGNYLLNRYSVQYNSSCSVLKEAGAPKCATVMAIDGGINSHGPAAKAVPCANTIYSLWKCDTNATSFIASRLQHYIQYEFPVAQALQKAKLDYLRDPSIEGRFKTPAYWAGLCLTGQFETAPAIANWWNYILPAALVLLVLIVAIGFHRFRRRLDHDTAIS